MNQPAENSEGNLPFCSSDWFLQLLVEMVNQSTISIGITLQLGGILVTGDLISGKAYFEGFGEDLSGPFKQFPDAAESIKETFSKCGEVYRVEDAGKEPRPEFIHLKNAQFFIPAARPIPTDHGVWWRGRISEVAGFVLGRLSHA